MGFELTFENRCNCLIDYQTLGGGNNVTRDDLVGIARECSLFDLTSSVIPATGALNTGTGPVIGSVGFGDQYLCYSVSGELNRGAVKGNTRYVLHRLLECTHRHTVLIR